MIKSCLHVTTLQEVKKIMQECRALDREEMIKRPRRDKRQWGMLNASQEVLLLLGLEDKIILVKLGKKIRM